MWAFTKGEGTARVIPVAIHLPSDDETEGTEFFVLNDLEAAEASVLREFMEMGNESRIHRMVYECYYHSDVGIGRFEVNQ